MAIIFHSLITIYVHVLSNSSLYCCCAVITSITVLSTDRGYTFTFALMATTSAYEHAYINVYAQRVHIGMLGMIIPNLNFFRDLHKNVQ